MATQNLFEKYGIKDVADVTFYRIEKKEKTYEAQRNITVASILKGAVELRTVYPIVNEGGVIKSSDEGFSAYVFTDASILTGANYDCDDGYYSGSFTIDGVLVPGSDPAEYTAPESGVLEAAALQDAGFAPMTPVVGGVHITAPSTWNETGNNVEYWFVLQESASEVTTGVVTGPASQASQADANKFPGTHEYSYAEQAFMLFAKRQNLIGVTGTRYKFSDIDNLMGTLAFDDGYALAPNSTERVVVLGPKATYVETTDRVASWLESDYDVSDVDELLNALTTAFIAKAYDVTYGTYAELVVEDEMGYYNPKFLGLHYDKATQTIDTNYSTLSADKQDGALANAVMWGKDTHFSINDAIAALRQELLRIDADSTSAEGIAKLFGGYKVSDVIPNRGAADLDDSGAIYNYYNATAEAGHSFATSQYSLEKVLEALDVLALEEALRGKDVAVDYTPGKESNRAIYVDTKGTNVAASSYIYLLHNKNYRKLGSDTEGIFSFTDRKGNPVYYQDKIFAKTEWLALVIVGTKGYIFVVNRNGNKDVSRIAWMVSERDFVTDKAAKSLVNNGLIHTTNITVNDETFEATCAVKSLSVRKTVKTVKQYTPVLFLDTLKVSTIEQTAEETYATGGHGNANLIGWDFGKSITLSLEDALFTPASFSASFGADDDGDFRKGVKETKQIDRMEKCIAKRSFIVPAGNQNGTPTEADKTAQAVFINPNTMEPYADGTPIAEGEIFLKFTRSVAYEGQSIGHTIEISADKFPGTYKVVGDTFVKNKDTGKEERFQFIVPEAKMNSERTITLEADGDPVVFDMSLTVLRPDDGVMVRFVQYDVVENEEENDGSTMVVGTENLNLLDNAELFEINGASGTDESYIGATEY